MKTGKRTTPAKPARQAKHVPRARLAPGLVAVLLAAALWLAPLPAAWVERWYSRGVYPAWERVAVLLTNLLPIAIFDLIVLAIAAAAAVWAVRAKRLRSWRYVSGRLLLMLGVIGLWFQLGWGLNYRRVPVADSLGLEVPQEASALERFALAAGDRARASAGELPRGDRYSASRVVAELAPAFARVQQRLGLPVSARPGRPKRSLFNPYFRWAAIDGVTNPLVPEIMVASDLTPAEVHATVAHEWAHLAGYASEDEASFVGWLICLEAGGAARYSAWLFALLKAAGASPAEGREWLRRGGPEVVADIRAIQARYLRSSETVREAASATYDQFLRANRVKGGIESYDAVLQLMLAAGPDPVLPGR